MNNKIISAIKERKVIKFNYNGGIHVVEPFSYGISVEGNELLRVYQIEGYSDEEDSTGWKLIRINKISNLVVLNESIDERREGYNSNDPAMLRIFYSIETNKSDNEYLNINNQEKTLINEYFNNVELIKDIAKEIRNGKTLDLVKVDTIADSILSKLNENISIILNIKKIQTAENYNYNHCVDVAFLAMMIGKWLKKDDKEIKNLIYAGLLHDIGKAKVDRKILNKPGKLTCEEYEEIKKHVVYAEEILKSTPEINKDIYEGIIMHHEREDGTGYMMRIDGSKIHDIGKILAIADVYDAMTSSRVYSKKNNPFDVFEHIRQSSYNALDPAVGITFLQHMANFYIGETCRLNNGEVGEVIKINTSDLCRPLIRIKNTYMDLVQESKLKIVELI